MTPGSAISPIEQPPGSRIERLQVSEDELLFHIPASGKWGGWLVFTILWNGILLGIWSVGLEPSQGVARGELMLNLCLSLFLGVGIAMGYVALRVRFATHLLYLGSKRVRLQRKLFRTANRDLATGEISRVKIVEFYQQNYKPVQGIEIVAGKRRIRFGSALTDPEKQWLAGEIRAFLHLSELPAAARGDLPQVAVGSAK